MIEQEVQYIQEKVLYYGWISEEEWNEQIPQYQPTLYPNFLQWLIQKKLLTEEQAQLIRPGLNQFSEGSDSSATMAASPTLVGTGAESLAATMAGPLPDVAVPAPTVAPPIVVSSSPQRTGNTSVAMNSPAPVVAPQIAPVLPPSANTMQQTLNMDFAGEASNAVANQQTLSVDFSQPTPTPRQNSTPTTMPVENNRGFDPNSRQLGPYQILEKIGEGGMGQVYKAKHTFLDKLVALKVLAQHLASNQQFVERFFREAKSCGKMDHPNVVRSLDAGEIGGVCFLALEFVEGKPLSVLVREGSVNQAQAVKYLLGILRALDYAESLRLVHRDIKPDNIMITNKGVAKLLDMGLTKEVGDTSMTKAGQILGTPDYISPEQARGDMNIDIRSDIYSLGATFYQVLSGQKPFHADSIIGLLNKHMTQPVPPLLQVKPHLDKDLCVIIEKMLAKDKADRFLHPRDIIKEIDALIQKSKQGGEASSVPVEETPVPIPAQNQNVVSGSRRNPDAPLRPAPSVPVLNKEVESLPTVKKAETSFPKSDKTANLTGFKPSSIAREPLEFAPKKAETSSKNSSQKWILLGGVFILLIGIVAFILFFGNN